MEQHKKSGRARAYLLSSLCLLFVLLVLWLDLKNLLVDLLVDCWLAVRYLHCRRSQWLGWVAGCLLVGCWLAAGCSDDCSSWYLRQFIIEMMVNLLVAC